MKKIILSTLLHIFILSLSQPAFAIDYQRVFVLGDSGADGGLSQTARYSAMRNLQSAFPEDTIQVSFSKMRSGESNPDIEKLYGCSYEGRQSNGYTFVEYAAIKNYNFTPNTFFNYAESGARSYDPEVVGNFPSMSSQVNALKQDMPEGLNSGDLVIIAIGANDLWSVFHNEPYPPTGQATTPQQAVSRLQEKVKAATIELYQLGARKFIYVNIMDISKLPAFSVGNVDQAQLALAKQTIELYNQKPLESTDRAASRNFGYSAADINNATAGLPKTVKELIDLAQANNSPIEAKIFDRATTFYFLLDSNLYPAADNTVYDGVGNIYDACAQTVVGQETSDGKYNLPAFDKYIYFDGVHFARRANQFFGNVLADFIK